jgi:tRNA-splicing ligase RtcB
MPVQIETFGPVDERAKEQLERCATSGDAPFAVLCADHHVGYSQPIGGAVAYEHFISPSGVGYDIGCGNKAVRTNLLAQDIDIKKIMDQVAKQIGFGVGRPNPRPIEHPVFDHIAKAEFKPQRKLLDMAREQLGTVGGGNHYVDLFEDEKGRLWIGVHFGSRGFGHRTAAGFLALARGLKFEDKAPEGSMDAPPTLLDTREALGLDYLAAMHLAGEYSYAGRDMVVAKVLRILGAESEEEIHNHHNFAWQEEHFGQKLWVIRKGCTPAFPGQKGFVGSNMSDTSVILEGVDSDASRKSLYSTVHGAGRVMSRRQAAGKMKWTKDRSGNRHQVQVSPGLVDWQAVQEKVRSQGVELRGAGPDEAPEVYKKLDEVLQYHDGTIKILHRLKPIGVAMAGAGIVDPYKD